MKPEFAALPEGFSLRSHGRSGFVYFRERERVLELYWEISGVEDYDWLLSLEATKSWAHPKEEKVPEAERQRIVDALESWLASKKIRTDAFPPIKRNLFP
ncbi:MAG TPA: Imm74 family immunity protein [Candidatus Paceibacterota bacterium]|nr:Imm74 family immunity protein [Candidatus Paceibacterota bacterium]